MHVNIHIVVCVILHAQTMGDLYRFFQVSIVLNDTWMSYW